MTCVRLGALLLAAVQPLHLLLQPHRLLRRGRRRRERRRRRHERTRQAAKWAQWRGRCVGQAWQLQLRRRRGAALVQVVEVAIERDRDRHERVGGGVVLAAHVRENLPSLLQQACQLVRRPPARRRLDVVDEQRVGQLCDRSALREGFGASLAHLRTRVQPVVAWGCPRGG